MRELSFSFSFVNHKIPVAGKGIWDNGKLTAFLSAEGKTILQKLCREINIKIQKQEICEQVAS